MRFLITFVIIAFSYFPVAHALTEQPTANQASLLSNLANKSLLLDITKVADNKLVAVGHHGHIITSTDGEQWQQASVPVQTTLTSVFFINEKLGWAVGHDALILHTSDGGVHWQIQQHLPALEKPLLDVYFKDKHEGVAIGAYGMFYRTVNGGKTWQSEFHQAFLHPDDVEYIEELRLEDEEAYLDEIAFILPHFNRVQAIGNTFYLIGEVGLIAKSDDFGKTWQAFENFYQGSFYAFSAIKESQLIVAGLRGHVFTLGESAQQGDINTRTWQEITTNTTALLNDIVVSDNGVIHILGNNGMLLISHDEGLTFEQQIQPDGKALIAGVWFNGKLVAVSDVGVKNIDITSMN